MKKLEKYKIVPQAKFVKFKVKHLVEIPTIRHDKAVPPLLDCKKQSFPPWMCPHPGSWSLAVVPPDQNFGKIYPVLIKTSLFWLPFFKKKSIQIQENVFPNFCSYRNRTARSQNCPLILFKLKTFFKGHLCYKTITSLNVPSEVQVKNFFVS